MSLAASAASARICAALACSAGLHAVALGGLPSVLGGEVAIPARAGELQLRFAQARPPAPAERPAALLPVRSTARSSPDSGIIPLPRYYKGSELSVRPAPLGPIEPKPAAQSTAASAAGKVLARILINESGAVDRVIIESAQPAGVFDESVVSAFGAARYRPGVLSGRAVKSQMLVEVTFREPAELGTRTAAPRP
jgi:TonB family protein